MHLSCACMASDTQQVMQVLTCMSRGSEIIWAARASMHAYDGMMQPDDPIRVLLANFFTYEEYRAVVTVSVIPYLVSIVQGYKVRQFALG